MLSSRATFRFLAGTLFTVGGICLTLASLSGAPSFWYIPCVGALIPLGFAWWLCKPSFAAALSVGPVVSVLLLLQYSAGLWASSHIFTAVTIAGSAVAVALVVSALHESQGWRLPLTISLAFIGCAFATDRLFTNQLAVRTYQMNVALNGKVPWGEVGPQGEDGRLPIVLYRAVGRNYCYEEVNSQVLRERLATKDGGTVAVEFNIFSDFGRERSYNVRSVDGILLNSAEHVVQDAWRGGGQILGGEKSVECW